MCVVLNVSELFLADVSYLYVLDDLGVEGVIVGVGRNFCSAVLEQVLLPWG